MSCHAIFAMATLRYADMLLFLRLFRRLIIISDDAAID